MDKKDIQKELGWMENELRALKSPQGAITSVNGYFAYIDNPSAKVKITYEDGNNDILTKVYVVSPNMFRDTMLTTPNGNEQYILVYPETNVQTYLIVSTRPILSVENVS